MSDGEGGGTLVGWMEPGRGMEPAGGAQMLELQEEESGTAVRLAPGGRRPLPPKQLPVLPLAVRTWNLNKLRRSERWKDAGWPFSDINVCTNCLGSR